MRRTHHTLGASPATHASDCATLMQSLRGSHRASGAGAASPAHCPPTTVPCAVATSPRPASQRRCRAVQAMGAQRCGARRAGASARRFAAGASCGRARGSDAGPQVQPWGRVPRRSAPCLQALAWQAMASQHRCRATSGAGRAEALLAARCALAHPRGGSWPGHPVVGRGAAARGRKSSPGPRSPVLQAMATSARPASQR